MSFTVGNVCVVTLITCQKLKQTKSEKNNNHSFSSVFLRTMGMSDPIFTNLGKNSLVGVPGSLRF